MRFAIIYVGIGLITAVVYAVIDALMGRHNPSKGVPMANVIVLSIFLWWIMIPCMIHDTITGMRAMRAGKRGPVDKALADIIYKRYVDLCADFNVSPVSRDGEWLKHYDLVLLLEEMKK